MRSLVFSSEDCLWIVSLLIFEHICSLNPSVTHGGWLCALTSYGWFVDAVFLCRFSLSSLKMFMLCPGEIRPLGLGLVVLFLGLQVVPQFQKTVGEPILPGYAGTTADGEMQLVSVELPVPVRETSQRRGLFECNSRRFSFLKSYIFAEHFILSQVSG